MRDLADTSGPWQGWWIQGSKRGTQRLRLVFSCGRILGEGADQSGEFDVTGEFDQTDVQITKKYSFWDVRYDGQWDGAMIAGRWTIREGSSYFETGVFEIWPESGEDAAVGALEELVRASESG